MMIISLNLMKSLKLSKKTMKMETFYLYQQAALTTIEAVQTFKSKSK